MTIAAFDPSLTHFAWVLLDETKEGKNALLKYGTFMTSTSDGLMVHRMILQRERVRKFLIDNNIKFVAMEAPVWGQYATEILFALNQYVHEVFLNLGIFVLYVQNQSLKKFACPKFKAKEITKHHMVHQAKTELDMHGHQFSEHLSDAYFVGKMGSIFYNWYIEKKITDEDLSEHLIDLYAGKHTFTKGSKKGVTEYTGIIYKENEYFFDYNKQLRKTQTIINEVTNGHK
jgi:hypothetical protein